MDYILSEEAFWQMVMECLFTNSNFSLNIIFKWNKDTKWHFRFENVQYSNKCECIA